MLKFWLPSIFMRHSETKESKEKEAIKTQLQNVFQPVYNTLQRLEASVTKYDIATTSAVQKTEKFKF
jgi:hypothetical protein